MDLPPSGDQQLHAADQVSTSEPSRLAERYGKGQPTGAGVELPVQAWVFLAAGMGSLA